MKLGYGIVGSGAIAKVHAECISANTNTSLVAIFTENSKRNQDLSKSFNTSIINDVNSFYSHPEIDCIVVCNESGKHGETIELAAKNGKHILCEKPIEVSLEKIDRIAKIIEKNKVILSVVYQNRWNPEYQRLKRILEQSLLGTLLISHAQINWYRSPEYYSSNPWRGTIELDGGAALMNQGIHTIDLWLNLLGDLKQIGGKIATRVHQIEGEDIAVAFTEFENGVLGTLSAGTALFPGYPERIEIFGSLGSICFEAGKITSSTLPEILINSIEKDLPICKANPKISSIDLHQAVHIDFMESILNNKTPQVTLKTARKSVALIQALYASSKNKTITQIK